jgi:DNA-binding LacI/PurR family transcriptional regulator
MAKRTTAQDVATLAGVSRTTVSFVLNEVAGMRIAEETRQRVLEAAAQLDYHPDATARRMVKGRTKIIGFVLRQTPDQAFSDRFVPQVLHGLSKAASAEGYHILIEAAPPDDHNSYWRLIRERHVDGIVLSGPRFDDEDQLRAHLEGSPVVLMGQLPNTELPFVDVDNVSGAARVTQHLIGLGHQRIAFISNAHPAYTASAQRLKGYRQAVEAAGLPCDESLVRYGDFSPASGEAAMTDILQNGLRPTGVFVASDTVAMGALKAIRAAGLNVPRDIALVGFDDAPMSEFVDPPLTTMRLPAFGLGWGSGDMLIRLINQEVIQQPAILLETELIVRKSCGAQTS